MTRLIDIKCFWESLNDYDFAGENVFKGEWKGQLLLEDDGWFEGIVIDDDGSSIWNKFIFGIYYPEKIIELVKLSRNEISAPFIFHGKKSDKGYEGQFKTKGFYAYDIVTPRVITEGNCNIIMLDNELTIENAHEEMSALRRIILAFRDDDRIRNRINRQLYENTISIRDTLTKKILDEYDKGIFPPKDIEEIKLTKKIL